MSHCVMMMDGSQEASSGAGEMAAELCYRPLTPGDEASIRVLCGECFPISYPDQWYIYITSHRVYSQGAFGGRGQLLGLLVAELQPLSTVEGEVGPALERSEVSTTTMYIISLGVTGRYRRHGIGRHLMMSLLDHVTRLPDCQLVYLHVLATNTQAIEFYRGLSFSMHALIPGYYRISQKPADGLLLVCYCNGGETFSHSLSAYLRRYVTESVCCRMLDGLCCSLSQWLQAGWERAGMGRTSASKQHVTPPPCC